MADASALRSASRTCSLTRRSRGSLGTRSCTRASGTTICVARASRRHWAAIWEPARSTPDRT
eukprot:8042733-Pyramimonas_sp.AAC.1